MFLLYGAPPVLYVPHYRRRILEVARHKCVLKLTQLLGLGLSNKQTIFAEIHAFDILVYLLLLLILALFLARSKSDLSWSRSVSESMSFLRISESSSSSILIFLSKNKLSFEGSGALPRLLVFKRNTNFYSLLDNSYYYNQQFSC